MKIRSMAILLLGGFSGLPSLAHALSCEAPVSAKANLAGATTVILGTVLNVVPEGSKEIWEGNTVPVAKVTLRVDRWWKGPRKRNYFFYVHASDKRYAKDKVYLLYLRKYGARKLEGAFDCNDPVEPGVCQQKDLLELGPGKPGK